MEILPGDLCAFMEIPDKYAQINIVAILCKFQHNGFHPLVRRYAENSDFSLIHRVPLS